MSAVDETILGTPVSNEVLVARQPILGRHEELYAHELLYRSSRRNAFDGTEASVATSRLINNTFLTIGIEKLSSGKRVFINFDRQLLVNGYAELMPNELVVVEILETVTPDAEVIEACRKLKSKNFLLALDDFAGDSAFEPLIEMSDIIKVDFLLTSEEQQEEIAQRYGHNKIRLLAEKVESRQEFERARRIGYKYFQGYFFSKPLLVAGKEVPGFKLNYLRVLKETSAPELDFNKLEDILLHEPSLVHKLLRFINSAQFGWDRKIESIRHALTLLGEKEIRKWVSLVAMSNLASDKPLKLVTDAVVRGRFLEILASQLGLGHRKQELFLLGMFSLLDAVLDQPMEKIVSEVLLPDDVQDVLLGRTVRTQYLTEALALARGYEGADWPVIERMAAAIEVPLEMVARSYATSVAWTDAIFHL